MTLPESVTEFLEARARANGIEWATLPKEENLLRRGALDSFALVEVVALLEEAAGKRVSPADLAVTNFDSVAKIEAYWEKFRR